MILKFLVLLGLLIVSNMSLGNAPSYSTLSPDLMFSMRKTEPVQGQKVIYSNSANIPAMDEIGEKPYKLLIMAQAGLNVPEFFVIKADGSGQITITDELRKAFDEIPKPVLVRSAHRDEGKKGCSFSGVFKTYGNISALEKTQDDCFDPTLAGPTKIESVQMAYEVITFKADPKNNYRLREYLLKQTGIQDFDPNQMNVIVMEQIDVEIFGMFLTSDQNDPQKICIHYEIRNEKFGKIGTGGIIVYDKKTNKLEEAEHLDENAQKILIGFGKTAEKIENIFGVQQIELGASNGEIYTFQSRDIDLGDPFQPPRLAHYESLWQVRFSAIGYGYFYLPVLVIDNVRQGDLDDKLYRKKLYEYREEISRFCKEHDKYILVLKDVRHFINTDPAVDPGIKEKDYTLLNSLIGAAPVVIRNYRQGAICHSEWDPVERGGITIMGNKFAELDNCFAHKAGEKVEEFPWRRPNSRDFMPVSM